jgi:hypothetical protein
LPSIPSLARKVIYSALELSPLKKNCCPGEFPFPIFVFAILEMTVFVCRPLVVEAICA